MDRLHWVHMDVFFLLILTAPCKPEETNRLHLLSEFLSISVLDTLSICRGFSSMNARILGLQTLVILPCP